MPKTEKQKQDLAFNQGILWACGQVIEMGRNPTLAVEILAAAGVKLEEADVHDRKILRPHFKEMERLRQCRK